MDERKKDRKIIKDEFNQVYKKDGYLYIPKNVQKMDAYLLCTGITYSVCEMLIANKLIDSKKIYIIYLGEVAQINFRFQKQITKKFFYIIIVCTSIIQIYYRRN